MMQDNREQIIKSIQVYINEKMSDYAIMINGAWGSGKTYFVKNELIPELEQDKPVIYISLFGIKTIDDLVNVMSLHILNIYSNGRAQKRANLNANSSGRINSRNISSTSKVATTLMGLISKGLKVVPKGEDTKAFVSELQRNSIKFSHYVFIFDDFERSIIDKIELLGFFDELVEQNNAKVIIVCNESKITNGRKENNNSMVKENEESIDKRLVDDYKLYKEKVIGLTIKYEADLEFVYDSVLSKLFCNDDYNLLLYNRDNVLDLFSRVNSHNLRTLIFTFKRFKELKKALEIVFEKNGNDSSYFRGYMIQVLFNLVAVAIEYKDLGKGIVEISADKDTTVKTFSEDGFSNSNDCFDIKKYIRITRYINYYISDYILDYKLVTEDIKRYILEVQNDTQTIVTKVNSIFAIEDDKDARQKLDTILENIENNKYYLEVYPRILSNLFILMEIFYYDDGERLNELKKDIMDNAIKRVREFDVSNWFYFSSSNACANEFNSQLYEKLKSMYNDARISKYIEDFNSADEVAEIIRKLMDLGSAVEEGRSLLSYIPVAIIVNRVMEASNNDIQLIHGILRHNYLNVTNIKDIRHGDICMFKEWRDMMSKQMDTIDSKLKYFHIKLLLNCIKDICNKLE